MVIFLRRAVVVLGAAGAATAVLGVAALRLRDRPADEPPPRSWRELSGPGLR